MNINYQKIKVFDIRKDNKISKLAEEKVFEIDAICIIANLDVDEHIKIVKDLLLKYDIMLFKVIIDINNNNTHTTKYNYLKNIYDAIIIVSENEVNEVLDTINKLVNPDGPVSIDLSDLKTFLNKSFMGEMYIEKNNGYYTGEKCALQILCRLTNKYILKEIKKCIIHIKYRKKCGFIGYKSFC